MKKIIATVLAMVMALALCTTAFAAGVTEGFIKATDAASKDVTPESVQLNYVKNTDPKTTDGKTAYGTYAHYTVTGATTTTALNADYIVVNSLAEATHVLYKEVEGKNVVMYLAKVPTGAQYVAGKVYNDFADACGKYDKPASYDATKTYYTCEVNGTEYLAVADSDNGNYLLVVDGKVVVVKDVATETAKVSHVAIPTVKDGKITGYTCSKCKLAAVEAPNYASIPETGTALGTGYGNWYWPAAASSTTTTTGTTSPKTFDAGIAMYVGMALTSVAGSAVVIGKKKEF